MAPKREIAGNEGGKRDAEQRERVLLARLRPVDAVDGMARFSRAEDGCPARSRIIEKSRFLGYRRQGDGMRAGMAAADGKGDRPE